MGADPDPGDQASKDAKPEAVSGVSAKAPAAEASNKPAPPSGPPNHMLILGAAVLVIAAAVMEQIGEFQTPQKWANSLFEPHVVDAPAADDSTVTIQFCQS